MANSTLGGEIAAKISSFAEKRGFHGQLTSVGQLKDLGLIPQINFSNGGEIFNQDAQEQILAAYNYGVSNQDFTPLLSLIEFKQADGHLRRENAYSVAYNGITGKKKEFISYLEKARSIKDIKDSTTSDKFWELMSAAGYSDRIYQQAEDDRTALAVVQNELIHGKLNKGAIPNFDHKKEKFLAELGVNVEFLKSIVSGKEVPSKVLSQRSGEIDFNMARADEQLTNIGVQATSIAGQQAISALAEPIFLSHLGIIQESMPVKQRDRKGRPLGASKTEFIDVSLLSLGDLKAQLSSSKEARAFERIFKDGYDKSLDESFSEFESKAKMLKDVFYSKMPGKRFSVIDAAVEERISNLGVSAERRESFAAEARDEILTYFSKECIKTGAYAQKDRLSFYHQAYVAASSNEMRDVFDLQPIQTPDGKYVLPVTFITDKDLICKMLPIKGPDISEITADYCLQWLKDDAKKSVSSKEQMREDSVRLEGVRAEDVVIGTNPLLSSIQERFLEEKSKAPKKLAVEEECKINMPIGKSIAQDIAKKGVETKPCLFRDLPRYKQLLAQEREWMRAYLSSYQLPYSMQSSRSADSSASSVSGQKENHSESRTSGSTASGDGTGSSKHDKKETDEGKSSKKQDSDSQDSDESSIAEEGSPVNNDEKEKGSPVNNDEKKEGSPAGAQIVEEVRRRSEAEHGKGVDTTSVAGNGEESEDSVFKVSDPSQSSSEQDQGGQAQ